MEMSTLTLNNPPSERTMADNASPIEFVDISLATDTGTIDQARGQQPPPADRGKEAYLFLAACFILEALVWGQCRPMRCHDRHRTDHVDTTNIGLPFTYGVFQNYYSTHEPFQGSGNFAIIGTTALVGEDL